MLMALIYKVTNLINNKKYIGHTSKELKKRKFQHKEFALKRNSPFAFHQAIRKHGWKNFKWEVIYESRDTEHCLTVMEPFFIDEYDTFGETGYNMDKGGRKGMLGLKRKPLTEEQRHNVSVGTKRNALRGKDHPMYGTKANEKFLQAAKISMVGKSHSNETKKKQSESHKEYLKNNKSGMFGKKHNDETKQKMKLKRMESWALYNPKTKETLLINDLMNYCQINMLNYKTVYSWKYKSVDGKQMLTKVK
jgi:group I intron endonuclease